MDFLTLLGGLALLLICGELLVKGAVAIALRFRLSKLVVGLTVVAFGTSAPELVVCINAAVGGHPDIAIGNIIGSNIANLALIMGFATIIFPIHVHKNTLRFDWPMMMITSVVFYILIIDLKISLIEGILFTSTLILYLYLTIARSRRDLVEVETIQEDVKSKDQKILTSILFTIVGSAGLAFGAHWFVEGASNLAIRIGVSESVVGERFTKVAELSRSQARCRASSCVHALDLLEYSARNDESLNLRGAFADGG